MTRSHDKKVQKLSKFLALVLRHSPTACGLTLDSQGWTPIDDLLAGAALQGKTITRGLLDEIVESDEKDRYEISEGLIRAAQGHSVDDRVECEQAVPPAQLFHSTHRGAVPTIKKYGLSPVGQYVHLSAALAPAKAVGARRGRPIILTIDAAGMGAEGFVFYLASDEVWLADHVPPRFIGY